MGGSRPPSGGGLVEDLGEGIKRATHVNVGDESQGGIISNMINSFTELPGNVVAQGGRDMKNIDHPIQEAWGEISGANRQRKDDMNKEDAIRAQLLQEQTDKRNQQARDQQMDLNASMSTQGIRAAAGGGRNRASIMFNGDGSGVDQKDFLGL